MTEAKHDPSDSTDQTSQPEQPAETDVKARFREALERKNATPGTHPGSQADGGTAMKSSNGKRKREFRRKSGG